MNETNVEASKWIPILVMSIDALGSVLNLICVVVFANPSLKDSTYKLMLANSIVEFFYTFLNIFIVYFEYESTYTSFVSNFFQIYIDSYLTSCLAICSILIECHISFKRYLLIKNKRTLENVSNVRVLAFLAILSLLFYSPMLFVLRLIKNEEKQSYSTVLTEFGLTRLGKSVPILLSVIRIILVLVVQLGINVLFVVAFRSHLKRKARLRINKTSFSINNNSIAPASDAQSTLDVSAKKGSPNQTMSLGINLMIISISFVFIFGTLPYVVQYMLSFVMPISYGVRAFAEVCLSIMHGIGIFIFYAFNANFRQTLNSYFKIIFTEINNLFFLKK